MDISGLSKLTSEQKRERLKMMIQEKNAHRFFPVSFAQQRLWFLDQLEGPRSTYNMKFRLSLLGKLDIPLMERCLLAVVQRHETLRTTFTAVKGQPMQVIAPEIRLTIPAIDLQNLTEEDRTPVLNRIMDTEALRVFDLGKGPLVRINLIRLTRSEHILLVTLHHIISDGWSMGVFVGDVTALYRAFSENRPSPLKPLPVRYVDYAGWQQKLLSESRFQKKIAYWKDRLADAPSFLTLPTDFPRPPVQSERGDKYVHEFPAGLVPKLRALNLQTKATPFMSLQAVFLILVSRYTGREDLVVGSPHANRNRKELEPLIGFFVNTLILRNKLSGDETFLDLLARVRETTKGAHANQDVPFENLVAELKPERSLSHSPFFQLMFVLQNLPPQKLKLPDLSISPMEVESVGAKFDLVLSMTMTSASLTGRIEYCADLYERATVERLARHYETLLTAILENPASRIAALPMLSDRERHRLLIEWNETARELKRIKAIPRLFEAQVARTPNHLAVAFENHIVTYREFNQKANVLARILMEKGVGKGSYIPILMEQGHWVPLSIMAVLKTGAAYVPLDPKWPRKRLERVIAELSGEIVLVDEHARFPESLTGPRIVVEPDALIAEAEDPDVPIGMRDTIYIMYTSGSTGEPKGVMLRYLGIVNRFFWMNDYYGCDQTDVILQTTYHTFDSSIWQYFWPLINGGACVIPTPGPGFDPYLTLELIRLRRVTFTDFIPSAFDALVYLLETKPELSRHIETLRQLIVGADVMNRETVARFRAKFPRIGITNLYGPTEASIGNVYYEVPVQPPEIVPIGKPIHNVTVLALDKDLNLLPEGVPGELHVGGACVGLGYLNNPQKTKAVFIENPFPQVAGDRLYKTGDLVRLMPDGNILFLGRIDSQVKIRGYRIELSEIESVLAGHPEVSKAIALVKELRGENRLAVYIVPEKSENPFSEKDLNAFLKQSLPDYMIPSAYVFLSEFPLTSNGKIDFKALPEPETVGASNHAYVAPATRLEKDLAFIWREVLKRDRIGVHDNFFELGGHSLMATRVVSRINGELGVNVPVRELFEHPTIHAFAQTLPDQEVMPEETVPLVRVTRTGDLPLSFAQQRLWFLGQLGDLGAAYHIAAALWIDGELSRPALERTLQQLWHRHEILRTTFAQGDELAVQIVDEEATAFLPLVDLRGLPEPLPDQIAPGLFTIETQRVFDPQTGPLCRTTLIQIGPRRHFFVICMHHIISDAWSIGIMVRELTALYRANLLGEPPLLPELDVQYADYSVWQRAWLTGETLERQTDFWKQQLVGAPERLELPTSRPFPAEQSYAGDSLAFRLDKPLSESLAALSRESGATLFMTLLSGYAVLLARYSHQRDLVIGTPIANRHHRETEPLIGFFVNTLALRIRPGDHLSFSGLLDQVKHGALQAYSHQDLPFEKVIESLDVSRNPGFSPLFQAMFVLQNASTDVLKLPGVTFTGVEPEITTAKFELTLNMRETPDGLIGYFEYRTELFDRSAIERMAGHFQNILRAVVANPDADLWRLPIIGAAETEQLSARWNDTATPYPRDRCVHGLFEEWADRYPERPALSLLGQSMSYGELNNRANRMARVLAERGVERETRVGLLIDRSFDWIVSCLAVLKAGGAYVPLDPGYPPDRLRFMVEDSGIVRLIVDVPPDWLPENRYSVIAPNAWQGVEHALETGCVLEPEAAAYVMYTSGSTGRPKGVLVNHRNIVRLVRETNYISITPGDVFLQLAPVSFDAATFEIWGALLNGARLAVMHAQKPSLDEIGEVLEIEGVTILWLTAGLFQAMASTRLLALKPLNQLLAGGDVLPAREVAAVLEHLPETTLINGYGPTETTTFASCFVMDASSRLSPSIPIGKPVANTRIYLLDNHFQLSPIGVLGELWIGGDGVSRGYWSRPARTAASFVPDPFGEEPGARLYRTGDWGRFLPDSNIEFLGRRDAQVKLRGFRIELGEIESALREIPEIADCAVLAREDKPGDKQLVAYYVSQSEDIDPSPRLKRRLPDHMAPSVYIRLEALPLTANGKLDREALPAPGQPESAEAYIAPRTQTEQLLAVVWAELMERDRIGVHDDFFELGGHSLLAARLIARLRDRFSLDLPLHLVFRSPTLEAMARAVDEAFASVADGETDKPPLVRAHGTGPAPLSFSQRRLWFLDQMDGPNPTYNMPSSLRLTGLLNVAALEQSMREIVRRHDILRTVFAKTGEDPVQIVQPRGEWVVEVVDLQSEMSAAFHGLLAMERQRPFDLREGPLVRLILIRLSSREHILSVNMHHIISDGWSIGIMVRELGLFYGAAMRGLPMSLPALPLQFTDFARWQRAWMKSADYRRQMGYWKQQLEGLPPLLNLPTDGPRTASAARIAVQTLDFTKKEGDALSAWSRDQGVTTYMTALAAFSILLSYYSGQSDIAVGSQTANRPDPRVENLIGFFINALVMRTRISWDQTFRDVLKSVRKTTLDAYNNQDVPFEQLVEALNPKRSLNYAPLVQVSLEFQNAPGGALNLPGLSLSPVMEGFSLAKYDIVLTFEETPDRLNARFEYKSGLFDAKTIDGIRVSLKKILVTIQDRPEIPLNEIKSVLDDMDRERRKTAEKDVDAVSLRKLKRRRPRTAKVLS